MISIYFKLFTTQLVLKSKLDQFEIKLSWIQLASSFKDNQILGASIIVGIVVGEI